MVDGAAYQLERKRILVEIKKEKMDFRPRHFLTFYKIVFKHIFKYILKPAKP
jgi:hypothetical protein